MKLSVKLCKKKRYKAMTYVRSRGRNTTKMQGNKYANTMEMIEVVVALIFASCTI